MLTSAEMVKRPKMANSMLAVLEKHEASDFHVLYTGDESLVSCATHCYTMWPTSRAEVNQVVLPSPHQPKRMITLFFNGTGQYMLNILAGGGPWTVLTLVKELLVILTFLVSLDEGFLMRDMLPCILTMPLSTIQQISKRKVLSLASNG
jgi:hypothetical protein